MKPPDYTTIEGLRLHPLYEQLTYKQRQFLELYIPTKDETQAAAEAYGVPNNTARSLGDRLLRLWRVRTLLAAHWGYAVDMETNTKVSKEELAVLISSRLRAGTLNDADFKHLTDRYLQLQNWDIAGVKAKFKLKALKAEAPPADDVDVDELVRKLEEEQIK